MIPRPSTHSKALGPGVTGPELLVPTSAKLERPPGHTAQQPSCGAHSFMVDPSQVGSNPQPGASDPRQHTKSPYVTGTSVMGIKYKDGILIASDTLGAYGSTKRYKTVQRVFKVGHRGNVPRWGKESTDVHQMSAARYSWATTQLLCLFPPAIEACLTQRLPTCRSTSGL